MEIILIAAMAANRIIGRGGRIPWHNPDELRFFKETTMGHVVIMGKNTFDSLGRALPGRRNIVISRDPAFAAPACETAHSLTEALALCAGEKEHVFVIGGGRVFAEAIMLADGIIISVFDDAHEGDCVFPEIPAAFREINRIRYETAMPFTVFRYRRRRLPMAFREVVIVGAGASGLMAAGFAAAAGAQVTLLEKMPQSGKKLAISGKGRGNLTNTAAIAEFIGHFGAGGNFLRQAFARFFREDLLALLTEEGIATVSERGGRLFAASGRAQEVAVALRRRAARLGAELAENCRVQAIRRDGELFVVASDTGTIAAKTLILATGGSSYPRTGSTGDGYRLAAALGHSVMPIRPALVPLVTAPAPAPEVVGLSLRNIGLTVRIQGKKNVSDFGELSFTNDGLSGPLILKWSGAIVDALAAGRAVHLAIDLKPALTDEQLAARLRRDAQARAVEPLQSVLRGLMAKEMAPSCLRDTGLAAILAAARLVPGDWQKIHRWLKAREYTVIGHRPLAEALVTAGGVNLKEVNPYTMESRLVPGLYFAGEVLDLQADTGGYNLQAAFSTGALAGTSAGKRAQGSAG